MMDRRVGSGGGAVTLRMHVCSTRSFFDDRVGLVGMESQLLRHICNVTDTWRMRGERLLWGDWGG